MRRFVALGVILTFLLGVLHVAHPPYEIQPAQAATTDICVSTGGTPQNQLKVYSSHGKVFYIDSGQNQNVDAAYAGYRVENTDTSTQSNLWAKVDTFTGGVVGLANPRDAYYRIGDVEASGIAPAFFLLQAGISSTRAQSHVFRVYSGDPRLSGAQELYSCTYSFVAVKETIKAAANKVTSVGAVSANQIGGNLVVTVLGESGRIGSGTSSPDGQVLWFTPAGRSGWPSSSLKLTSTSIDFFSNGQRGSNQRLGSGPYSNQLVFTNLTGAGSLFGSLNPPRVFYTAVYTFAITGPVPSSIQAIPIAQISSGTQIKHTDVSGVTSLAGSSFSVSTPVTVGVTKTVSASIATSGDDRLLSYTVTLANSAGAVTLDSVVDEPSDGLTIKPGSSQYNGNPIPDPVLNAEGHLVFQGPFAVSGGTDQTPGNDSLTYQMVSTCSTGEFAYANTAYATIGGQIVGKDQTTVSGVTITGSCPATTGEVVVSDQTLDPEAVTQPASAIGETSSTLNGSVDPNGVPGLTVSFEWGTHPSLVGATATTVGASDDSASFYPVSTTLTNLTPGTRYYFRVIIGDAQGDILSFVTTEVAGTPEVITNAVSSVDASARTAVLNGTIDPNQRDTVPSFLWWSVGTAGTLQDCTPRPGSISSATVREDTTDNGSFDSDVLLTGAFPVEVSWEISGLTSNHVYCVVARGTETENGTQHEGSPVIFKVAAIDSQTITFSAPTQTNDSSPVVLDTVGQTANLGGTSSSGLTVVYSSNTPEVCTVSGSVVTIVGGGICSISADQGGNTSFYPAETVTVSFSVPSFTVTYNLNGGAGSPPVDGLSPYGKGAEVTVSAVIPNRSGNQFTGWNTSADGGGVARAANSTFTISSNTTLFAQWTPATTFTLSYDANGGSGAPATSSHVNGENVIVSGTEPVRLGYTFSGWNSSNAGTGNNFIAGSGSLAVSQDTTLFAKWRARIVYNGNGSTSGVVPSDANDYSPGDTVTVADNTGSLARSDFTFDGWDTQADGQGVKRVAGSTFTMSGAQTLYARWVSQVTYDANGSSSGTAPTDNTNYRPGQSVSVLSNPNSLARNNFVFGGWNEASDGLGTTYQGGNSFTNSGETTLYALWLAELSYNANYPGGSSGRGLPPGAGTALPGSQVLVDDQSTLGVTGKLFDGWNTEPNGEGTPFSPLDTISPTQNTVLYAQWIDVVTVIFNGNSNTGGSAPAKQDVGQGRSLSIPATPAGFSRTGHVFQGWNTQPDGQGTRYQPGGAFTPLANSTLFAEWSLIPIVSQSNGGSGGGGGSPAPAVTPPPPVPPGNSPERRVFPRVVPPVVVPPALTPAPPVTQSPPSPPSRTLATPSSPGLPGLRLATPPTGSPAPGSPGLGGAFSAPTLDLGVPAAPAGAGGSAPSGPVSSSSIGVRTIQEVSSEKMGGFAPGATTMLEILGARTAARFVVTEASQVDSIVLQRAIEASVPTQSADFFSIDRVQSVSEPLVPRAWTAQEREGIADVFAASGLAKPRNLSDFPVSEYSNWMLVETRSSTYAPGTEVYLALTSEPIILATAIVDERGEAVLIGTLPTELLTLGEHRIRLVGIRALDGAFVEEDGTVGITDDLLAEIQRFDLGTQSTIAIYGENPDGANHTALRVIPLVPEAPWWTLWLILGAAVVGLVARFVADRRPRVRRIGSSALALGLAIPGAVLGWLSTVVAVTWWALGLGLLAALLAALGPYRSSQDRVGRSGTPDN